ncbi:MAG: hypothetical protein IKT40_09515 [Bacilli bacterium]|nr:hypothetical protein [Bacilli bacterium]
MNISEIIIYFGFVAIFAFIFNFPWLYFSTKKEKKEFENFINNLNINDIYSSKIQLKQEDPFKEESQDITVKILDKKFNYDNVMWVKIMWNDKSISTMTARKLYSDFKKI